MKKLIIAMVAVCMAVCANAAVAKWQVANMRTPVATDPTQAETGIIPSTTAAFLSALTIELSYNGEKITELKTNANGMIAQSQFWTQAQTAAAAEAAGSAILSFDITATYAATEGTYVFNGSASKDLANVVSGSRDETVIFNGLTNGSWSFTPSAVPEPTSGLLLLLGVAGLALRRRRA